VRQILLTGGPHDGFVLATPATGPVVISDRMRRYDVYGPDGAYAGPADPVAAVGHWHISSELVQA